MINRFFTKVSLRLLGLTTCVSLMCACQPGSEVKTGDYEQVKARLKDGWGTYNTYNALAYVKMPEGFEIAFDFKYQASNFSGYLQRAHFVEEYGWNAAKLKALAHAWDGSYTKMEVDWQDVHAFIETATDGDDFVALIEPAKPQRYASNVVVRTGLVFNRPGSIKKDEEEVIFAQFKDASIAVYPVTPVERDFAVAASSPYLSFRLDAPVAISTGRQRTMDEVRQIILQQREAYAAAAGHFEGSSAEVYEAITTCLGWNTIYEPVKDRVLSTVSRSWNEKRGGYGLFAWDNFFMAYLCAIDHKDLAFANVIEHLNDVTDEGFVPNYSQGNGRMSWDRSQPPVGGIITKEIYKKYPEKWFLEMTFDKLLRWNRWWIERRLHDGLLCWGSHDSQNPYKEKAHNNHLAAVLESGLDDSPMYEDVPFDKETGLLLLHDVGLNGLYVADCEALAQIALVLGRIEEADELSLRASVFRENLKELWNEEKGIFMNRRTDTGEFVERYSPTLFYALMANAATPQQAQRMVDDYFYNEAYFWGDYIMPSIARNDSAFPKQRYWKGAIWAPMNFLVYLSLREYDGLKTAQKDLSDKSRELFLNEWRRKGFISENYSAFDGTGDDPRIKSHPFYSWGALLGIIPFIQDGVMPAPEKSIVRLAE